MIAAPFGAVVRLDLWQYRIPLLRPVPLADHTLTERTGLLLEWQRAVGPALWSEIAPLPGFSAETLRTCVDRCRHFFQGAAFADVQALGAALPADLPPALRFGLEAGVLQLSQRLPVARPMAHCRLLDTGMDLPSAFAPSVRCVKLKVGRADLATDLRRIEQVLALLPHAARLRLDANRSWTLEQATRLCARLETRRIEYLEEPLRPELSYARWNEHIAVPFAWDETLRAPSPILSPPRVGGSVPVDSTHTDAQRRDPRIPDLDLPGLQALVVKPMLLGLARTQALIAAAHTRGLKVVLSASYESNLSLDLYARLATLWKLDGPHGLDTFRLFGQALLHPLQEAQDPSETFDRPILGRAGLEHRARLL